ncbi:nucleic-acid-binding protein from transposon X-element [Trichonephila clavata]|uniref:Nucleic-acid-binding protein from transposon X-element n=1 Tax=Trichonephila clavata TaxID=2740835 RepID=A0A8X6L0Y4_TRICU|nr:nucleic-acid-binding protein from transposon X-element [Trichonephila clavata]
MGVTHQTPRGTLPSNPFKKKEGKIPETIAPNQKRLKQTIWSQPKTSLPNFRLATTWIPPTQSKVPPPTSCIPDPPHRRKNFTSRRSPIDNVSNQAALLKHLQQITKLKLEAKLIGSKFRIFPQTPYAYTLIRRYISENNLEGYTYMLPEDKKQRAVIRGLPTDMPPMEIISDLDKQGFRVDECHSMTNRKTGAPMPLFMLSMERTEFHKSIFRSVTAIVYVKVIVEILRKKYGPPQCFRCQGFFHSSKFCTRTPRCVKCAGNHLAKECEKLFGDKPKCCLCGGEHPANFLGCPKNPKPRIDAEKEKKRQQRAALTNPEPPKVNFWEQRTQTATQRQQPNTTTQPGPSTAPPPPSNPVNNQNSHSDLFEQLKNPAVQDTFDLLEQFITIATTIPSKVGRLKAIRNLNQDYVLVAGDLNAKHASWSPYAQQKVAGHTIRRFCDSTGFSLSAPFEPTHFHKSLHNTVIDMAISKGMAITEVSSIPELSSDHNPVLFEVSLDNFTSPALSTYAFPNWSKF